MGAHGRPTLRLAIQRSTEEQQGVQEYHGAGSPGPDHGAHVVADLESRHVAAELVRPVIAGLRKAASQ